MDKKVFECLEFRRNNVTRRKRCCWFNWNNIRREKKLKVDEYWNHFVIDKKKKIDPISECATLLFFMLIISWGSFFLVHAYDNHDMTQSSWIISVNIEMHIELNDKLWVTNIHKPIWLFVCASIACMCYDNDVRVNSTNSNFQHVLTTFPQTTNIRR